MPMGRAPAPILRNWAAVVPTRLIEETSWELLCPQENPLSNKKSAAVKSRKYFGNRFMFKLSVLFEF